MYLTLAKQTAVIQQRNTSIHCVIHVFGSPFRQIDLPIIEKQTVWMFVVGFNCSLRQYLGIHRDVSQRKEGSRD